MLGPARAVAGADETMPVSEVKAGMTGHGLTTLDGTGRRKFGVEVLGVLEGWEAKTDIILVRCSGDTIDQAGVISGMSGSPIYLNDRLVGAIAYGWPFCKIPLAGVTPIEQMLKVRETAADTPQEAENDARRRRWGMLRRRTKRLAADILDGKKLDYDRRMARLMLPPSGPGREASFRPSELPGRVRNLLPAGRRGSLSPLPVPLSVDGMSVGSSSPYLSQLQKAGFQVVGSSGSGRTDGSSPPLQPGAPVGALYVTGDMTLSGTGTATVVEDDTVLAFGHSMETMGQVDIPFTLARAVTVVPTLDNSFRMSAPTEVVGSITQDRTNAIMARLGEESPMFPCTVKIRGFANETYNFRVAHFWQMSPLLTTLAVSSSLARLEGQGSPYTVKAKARVELKGREKPLTMSNVYSTLQPSTAVMELVGLPLEMLMFNPHRDVRVESVSYTIEMEHGYRSAEIESVQVPRREVEPGGTLELLVRLRRFQGDTVTRLIEVPVPHDARPGTSAEVVVCDAGRSMALRRSTDPGFFSPKDFGMLVDKLEMLPDSTNIYVHAAFQRRGVRYDGEAMPDLPPSALQTLQFSGRFGRVSPLQEMVRHEKSTPWVVQGNRKAKVTVQKPGRGGRHRY